MMHAAEFFNTRHVRFVALAAGLAVMGIGAGNDVR
jgi:hypothetical protein